MPTFQPWHQLCKIREDVRTGTLTLDEFAADLRRPDRRSACRLQEPRRRPRPKGEH